MLYRHNISPYLAYGTHDNNSCRNRRRPCPDYQYKAYGNYLLSHYHCTFNAKCNNKPITVFKIILGISNYMSRSFDVGEMYMTFTTV